ncbi:MAG: alpha/beta hydrolase [Acidimicrobiales bacterium]|nr:alpha/beta hydrolase [Acidimicrobiales bacterium]
MAPGDEEGPARLTRREAVGLIGAAVGAASLGAGLLGACTGDDGGDDRSDGGPDDGSDGGATSSGGREIAFGDDGRAELTLPEGATAPAPVVVLLHGGFWRPGPDRHDLDPLVPGLVERGWATWNVDVAPLDDGAGWPSTFVAVAAAIDHLAGLAEDEPIDASRVAVVGHGSGGTLALWAAGRPGLPDAAPGAGPVVRPDAVVGLAAMTNLAAGSILDLGDGAVDELMGASTTSGGDRYLLASPIERLPVGVPVRLVHGAADPLVPVEQASTFADRARAAGDEVVLDVVDGATHLDVIDPDAPVWARVVDWLATRLD